MISGSLLHNAAITSFCLLSSPTTSSESQTITVGTVSHDLTGQITQLTTLDISTLDLTTTGATHTRANARTSVKSLATLHLQSSAVVLANSTSSYLLTASWDHLIGLCDTTVTKRRKIPRSRVVEGRKADGERAIRKAPLMVLKSHTGEYREPSLGVRVIVILQWSVSCGFDSTVRTWDTVVCTDCCKYFQALPISAIHKPYVPTKSTATEKPFLFLAATGLGSGSAVLAPSMTLYDLASSSLVSASFQHSTTPSCIVLGQGSSASLQVVMGAYDRVVRVWDLRSTKGAVVSFRAWDGGKKVLGVDWDTSVSVVGVGRLKVWKLGKTDEVILGYA